MKFLDSKHRTTIRVLKRVSVYILEILVLSEHTNIYIYVKQVKLMSDEVPYKENDGEMKKLSRELFSSRFLDFPSGGLWWLNGG